MQDQHLFFLFRLSKRSFRSWSFLDNSKLFLFEANLSWTCFTMSSDVGLNLLSRRGIFGNPSSESSDGTKFDSSSESEL